MKKIKVKKPKKPRQPRKAGVPRKPPVTNISVNIGSNHPNPHGSYYFPDAQHTQPLVNNIFTPAQNIPAAPNHFRPRILENAELQPFDVIPEPMNEVVHMATQTASRRPILVMNTGSQTQAPVPLLPPRSASAGGGSGSASAGGGSGSRGGLTGLNQQQLHDLARSLNIEVQDPARARPRSMEELRSAIKTQRSKQP
jgi:hypothetical protein